MKISEELRLEIQTSRNELYSAIYNHQIWHNKHLKDPENQEFIEKRDAFEVYIRSAAAHQKGVHNRLRQELEKTEGATPDEVKAFIASMFSNINNNNTTEDNAPTNDDVSGGDAEVVSNGIADDNLDPAKEDYEDNVCNGDLATDENEFLEKTRSVSVETVSADDTDVVQVPVEQKERSNKCERADGPEDKAQTPSKEKLSFFEVIGLTTTQNASDLLKKSLERKRRSNKPKPQFLYMEWEAATKRKRHCYLQSAGNVPQTRQTTARLKEPSPPPIRDEAANVVNVPVKAASPPPSSPPPPSSKALAKSLLPTQKATTRPNILRNMSESRVFPNKSLAKTDNENGQAPPATSTTTTKTGQSMTHSKTVHIPGLPSGLTIERIENDSAVCINCRNPGILSNCDNCEANYHVSCHSLSPPPPRLCPKCALKTIEPAAIIKRNDELEEKERQVYEHRDRNSDLRLQVYELEKRSQLLGQSLQLQHRTRQELLGKQEKTQRSIKRLVDFIKLVQIRNIKSSEQVAASTSYQARTSSSQSCQTPSPPRYRSPSPRETSPASTNRGSTSSSPITIGNEEETTSRPEAYHTQQRSSLIITYQDRPSPTCHSRINEPTSPAIPTNFPSSTSRKNCSKLVRKPESKTNARLAQQCRRDSWTREKKVLRRSRSSVLRGSSSSNSSRSSPDVSRSRSPVVGKNVRRGQCQDSRESSSRQKTETQSHLSTGTTTTWINYKNSRTTAECALARATPIIEEIRELPMTVLVVEKPTIIPPMEMERSASSSKTRESLKVKIKGVSPSRIFGPNTVQKKAATKMSTHCSQAITSPITSPIVSTYQNSPKERRHSDAKSLISHGETIKNVHASGRHSPSVLNVSKTSHQPNT